MNQQSNQQWILVVDDDAIFRSLLTDIFNSAGYTVFEARSSREASDSIRLGVPILAIVDYRLPDLDGVAWIQQVREAGYDNVPIVFLSGTFLDAHTFNRLRNVFRVSLILQKPIMPELFLEQIQSLLPAPAAGFQHDGETEIDDLARFSHITNLRIPKAQESALDDALAEARREFCLELPSMVQTLAHAVRHAREIGYDRSLFAEASNEAHKLKGSAGSFGYERIAECAARIERGLQALEPDEGTMQEILWSEIIRHLADAESAASDELGKMTGTASTLAHQSFSAAHSILVITASDDVVHATLRLQLADTEIAVADSLQSADSMINAHGYDVIILDQRVTDSASFMDFIMTKSFSDKPTPMILISEDDQSDSMPIFLYGGISTLLTHPVDSDQLQQGVSDALATHSNAPPRVLSVDDDPLLSGLITKVLTAEGMIVQALNQPIRVLEKLHEFRPDIVLLDVIMPGLSGYDVCRMLRATSEWNHLRIVFITSKSDEQGRASAYIAGADDFLPKPIVTSDLVRIVREQSKLIGTAEPGDCDASSGIMLADAFESAFAKLIVSSDQRLNVLTAGMIEVRSVAQEDFSDSERKEQEQLCLSKLEHLLVKRFRKQDVKARLGSHLIVLIEGQPGAVVSGALSLLVSEFESNDNSASFECEIKYGVATTPTDTIDGSVLLDIALSRCAL